jgi:hypothetical protein
MRYLLLAALIASFAWTAQADDAVDYPSCARASDPPICLATLAAPRLASRRPHEIIEAIVRTGAVDLVPRYKHIWIGVLRRRDQYAPDTFNLLQIPHPTGTVADYSVDVVAPVATAAIALAAAAQTHDDPFKHPVVAKLIVEARRDPTIPRMALDAWIQGHGSDSGSENTRPRGLRAIWRRIIAEPQFETPRLMSLARGAYIYGYPDEGLALLRIGLQRADISGNELAHAAWWLALRYGLLEEGEHLLERARPTVSPERLESAENQMAQARLLKGYDATAAKRLLRDCVGKDWGCSKVGQHLDGSTWRALERAGAKAELRELGLHYLSEAHKPNLRDEHRGNMFAYASESFRRAGDVTAALSAAREGLPFVAPAVAQRARTFPPAQTISEKRKAAIQANGFGTTPVIALYRAGARDEALSTGYLTGYHRYHHATVAGETPDPKWVFDDGGMFDVMVLTTQLVDSGNITDAERLYTILKNMKPNDLTLAFPEDVGSTLGSLAALLGRADETHAHFANSTMPDKPTASEPNRNAIAWFRARHAARWRQALTTLLRAKSGRT